MEDQRALEQTAALHYSMLQRERKLEYSQIFIHKHDPSSKACLSGSAPLFPPPNGDGRFCLPGRCTGLLSVVSAGASRCPTIHLCPHGWIFSQLFFFSLWKQTMCWKWNLYQTAGSVCVCVCVHAHARTCLRQTCESYLSEANIKDSLTFCENLTRPSFTLRQTLFTPPLKP